MLLDVAAVAVVLTIGNIAFRHFEPKRTLRRRLFKVLAVLAITALISYYFGRLGVAIAFGVAMVPVIYIHAIWLPRHGVNGWTGEPREKYHALRGWPPPPAL
jgi:cell division protein FtsW (lipid II flippase)